MNNEFDIHIGGKIIVNGKEISQDEFKKGIHVSEDDNSTNTINIGSNNTDCEINIGGDVIINSSPKKKKPKF